MTIEYVFKLNDGQAFNFEGDTERTYQARFDKVERPFWTKLNFQKCTLCPRRAMNFATAPPR